MGERKGPKAFADLAALPEDERIRVIAHHVLVHGLTVAVCVDDEPDKPERYERKLRALGCAVLSRSRGPVANVITLKVGPAHEN
jgi:hypothetical protein